MNEGTINGVDYKYRHNNDRWTEIHVYEFMFAADGLLDEAQVQTAVNFFRLGVQETLQGAGAAIQRGITFEGYAENLSLLG